MNGPEASAANPPASGDQGGLATPFPLFYKNPQPVNSQRHARAGVRARQNFSFARDTNAVPLGADELFVALAYYPIVFAGAKPVPVAVLGVGGHKNVFIDDAGQWRANTYVPAYIRRYPFILATGAPDQVYLAIDEAADSFSPDDGQPLFDGDAPSNVARQALEFCRAFQAQVELAQALGEALQEANVLVPRRVDVRRADGTLMSLDGFQVVDEARFEALPDSIFLTWRRRGFLGLIYAHLMSTRRWQTFTASAISP